MLKMIVQSVWKDGSWICSVVGVVLLSIFLYARRELALCCAISAPGFSHLFFWMLGPVLCFFSFENLLVTWWRLTPPSNKAPTYVMLGSVVVVVSMSVYGVLSISVL